MAEYLYMMSKQNAAGVPVMADVDSTTRRVAQSIDVGALLYVSQKQAWPNGYAGYLLTGVAWYVLQSMGSTGRYRGAAPVS